MRATATDLLFTRPTLSSAVRTLGALVIGLAPLAAAQAQTVPGLPAWTVTGVVVRVSDGDTVTLLDADLHNHKVRLAGIDAPERSQAFGQISHKVLGSALERRPVTAECQQQDRSGRSLCTLWLDGADLGLALVRAGLAWHYPEYIRDQTPRDAARYARAETEARLAGRGLWSQRKPMPPWDWRRSQARAGAVPQGAVRLP
jgi:endonuclease YncB( thermonuclease family)